MKDEFCYTHNLKHWPTVKLFRHSTLNVLSHTLMWTNYYYTRSAFSKQIKIFHNRLTSICCLEINIPVYVVVVTTLKLIFLLTVSQSRTFLHPHVGYFWSKLNILSLALRVAMGQSSSHSISLTICVIHIDFPINLVIN